MNQRVPNNVESERIILGNVLNGNLKIPALVAALDISDFYEERNRYVADAAIKIHERGEGISATTIFRHLQNNHISEVDLAYLSELSDNIPVICDLEGFIRSVKATSIQRKVISSCQSMIEKTLLDEDATETIDSGLKILGQLGSALEPEIDFVTPIEVIEQSGGIEDYIKQQSIPGVPSPWPKLNNITHGLHDGELIIMAGNTGKGKSAAALNYGYHAAKSGTGVAIYSMEMGRRELTNRLIGVAGKLNTQVIRKPLKEDASTIMRATGLLHGIPLWMCDRSACSVSSIESSVRRMRAKNPIGLVIVDYLNLMSPTGKSENRTQEVSKMSRGLKLLAMEFKIPVIAVCQLNRAAVKDKNRRPELHDLRESGSLEQDANVVIFLHSENNYDSQENTIMTDLIVAKQRNGPAPAIVKMWFQKYCGVFYEVEENQMENPEDTHEDQGGHRKKKKVKKSESEPTPPADENLAF